MQQQLSYVWLFFKFIDAMSRCKIANQPCKKQLGKVRSAKVGLAFFIQEKYNNRRKK